MGHHRLRRRHRSQERAGLSEGRRLVARRGHAARSAKAEDYARRHGVPRVHATADDLIADPEMDAVYIATPPSTHCDLALLVAAAGKPCLVEKPMALNHDECPHDGRRLPDRRRPSVGGVLPAGAPPLPAGARPARAGGDRPADVVHVQVTGPPRDRARATNWRFDPGGRRRGALPRFGSHCLDLLDFLVGADHGGSRIRLQHRRHLRRRRRHGARRFSSRPRVPGTGIWNFNAGANDRRHRSFRIGRHGWSRPSSRTATCRVPRTVATRFTHPQSSTRPSAADSDHRRRAARQGAMPVDRRVRRPHVLGHGKISEFVNW